MNNVRGLYPPLYGATANGGGSGGGGSIQVDTLPEASLEHKDKILQYTGATTETLTNGFFYKCVENTTYDWEETEASETYTEADTLPTASAETIGTIYKVDDKYYQTVIVLSYSWNSVPVMYVEPLTTSIDIPLNGEAKIGTIGTTDIYACCISEIVNGYNSAAWILALNIKDVYGVVGGFWTTQSITEGRPLGTSGVNIGECYFVDNMGLYTTYTGSGVTLRNIIVMYSKKS